ncbi:MAG: PAS domain S-box protein [Chloroflexaceae bacterium]|nr:PAS domain S-box protein [Chloroflexaceae bacterium]
MLVVQFFGETGAILGQIVILTAEVPTQPSLQQQLQRDLKQAEAALEGSEARYRSIFENAGVSIWIKDFSQLKTWLDELKARGVRDLRAYFQDCPAALEQAIELVTVKEVNQHSLKLFGATSKEELLASLTQIFTAATRSVFLEKVLALADGCRYFEAETRLKTLRGQYIHVFFTLAFPNSDSYDRVLVSILDISDRKLVEDTLRWREEELRLIANAIPALIAYVTKEGRYRFVNRAYTHWFGHPAEEILGQSVKDFMGEEAYSLMERDIETALSGQVVTAELWVSFPRVGRRYVRREYIPDFDELGQTKGFYAFNNDLTDLKLAEENLRQSEARFRHMAETIEDVFWIGDRQNYRLLYVSPAYEPIWGRSCASLYQNPSSWLESICPEDREQVRQVVQHQGQTDRFDLEYRIHREDGLIRWIRHRGFPMSVADGSPGCIAGLAEDITDRKVAAAALEKATNAWPCSMALPINCYYTSSRKPSSLTCSSSSLPIWGWNFI